MQQQRKHGCRKLAGHTVRDLRSSDAENEQELGGARHSGTQASGEQFPFKPLTVWTRLASNSLSSQAMGLEVCTTTLAFL